MRGVREKADALGCIRCHSSQVCATRSPCHKSLRGIVACFFCAHLNDAATRVVHDLRDAILVQVLERLDATVDLIESLNRMHVPVMKQMGPSVQADNCNDKNKDVRKNVSLPCRSHAFDDRIYALPELRSSPRRVSQAHCQKNKKHHSAPPRAPPRALLLYRPSSHDCASGTIAFCPK